MPQKIHLWNTKNRPAVGRFSSLAELGLRPIQAEPVHIHRERAAGMTIRKRLIAWALLTTVAAGVGLAGLGQAATGTAPANKWLWAVAHHIPSEYTNQESGYFSLIEGRNGRLYVGAAKYGVNSYMVEFDPNTDNMRLAVDTHKEIGTNATGFAAQSKIHTRNNVGESGRIYFGTKQGYPQKGETWNNYPGGYPMVYDPATGKTKVYPIPIANQGIISVTPHEWRNVAYISTHSDGQPAPSAHFMILDLATGKYRDLGDMNQVFAFIVVDDLGRAYHPLPDGTIARYDPAADKVEILKQTIDGKPPTPESGLVKSDCISWEISPDRKTLYAVSIYTNQLYSYDLMAKGDAIPGKSLGQPQPGAAKIDCRAMCVGPDGTVWIGLGSSTGEHMHLARYRPGDKAPENLGPIAIKNPDYAPMVDKDGKPLLLRQGIVKDPDGTLWPRYYNMAICASANGKVYMTTLYPFTLLEIAVPK